MSKLTEAVLTLDFLDALKIKLNDMPQKSLYTKKDAIIYLKEAIDSLIEKHYSTKEIAKFLEGEGLSITAPTLGRFLKEMTRTGKRKPRASNKGNLSDVQEITKGIEPKAASEDEGENGVRRGENAGISDAIDVPQQTGKGEAVIPDNGQAELNQSNVNAPALDEQAKHKPIAKKRRTNFEITADTDDL